MAVNKKPLGDDKIIIELQELAYDGNKDACYMLQEFAYNKRALEESRQRAEKLLEDIRQLKRISNQELNQTAASC